MRVSAVICSQQKKKTLTDNEERLLQELADESLKAYLDLKGHPEFMNYLSDVSPLKFYSETNIGSRPSKRGSSAKLTINDLRAIPFVGSWSHQVSAIFRAVRKTKHNRLRIVSA